jgi:DNA-binding NtrC family response regulator
MNDVAFPPLIKALVGQDGQYAPPVVFYKVLERQRADDVRALLTVVRELPASTVYRSVPPSREHWHHVDPRYALPSMIDRLTGNSGPAFDPQSVYREIRCRHDDPGTGPTLRRAYRRLLDQWMDWNQERQEAAAAVLDVIIKPPMPEFSPKDEEHLRRPPDHDAPVLVVGRPEKLYNWDQPLREVLIEAGYPNRFDFNVGVELFYDRKTGIGYAYVNPADVEDDPGTTHIIDGGFIFMGRRPSGAPLIVLAGHTAGATREAASLLTHRRKVFETAAEKFNAATDVCVDIGFLMLHGQRRTRLVDRNPVGFRWNRSGVERVRPLLDAFTSGRSGAIVRKETLTREKYEQLADTPSLAWVWDSPTPVQSGDRESHPPAGSPARAEAAVVAPGQQDTADPAGRAVSPAAPSSSAGPPRSVIRVKIDGRPYQVSEQHAIFLDYNIAEIYDDIRRNIEDDRASWQRRLEPNWSSLQKGEGTSSFQAFDPVLLLGETGCGKQLLAEFFAFGWRGVVLPYVQRDQGYTPGLANEDLTTLVSEWWGSPIWCSSRGEGDRMRTFGASAIPPTLLDSELFGVGCGAANDVRPNPSVFQTAGTGVLFMDELFELPPAQQVRFLGVLQNGRVLPIKVGHEFPIVCRVVAATNRAANEAELVQLTASDDARSDLVARFITRYEVPPLRERTLELIPALMDMLNSRIAHTGGSGPPCRYLRISRAALEFLVSHQFMDNFRALIRLSACIERRVVHSFVWSAEQLREQFDGDLQSTLEQCSIRFSDMAALHEGRQPDWLDIDLARKQRETDRCFYEFYFDDDVFSRALPPWKEYWQHFEKPRAPDRSLSHPLAEVVLGWLEDNREALSGACREVSQKLPLYFAQPTSGAAAGKASEQRERILLELEVTAAQLASSLWERVKQLPQEQRKEPVAKAVLGSLFLGHPVLARRMPYCHPPLIKIEPPGMVRPGPSLMRYVLTGGRSKLGGS